MKPALLYRDQLIHLGYGYPFYEPCPNRDPHVMIGDVGYVNRDIGHFHRLFNIYAENEAVNMYGIPENFQLLSQDPRNTYEMTPLSCGPHSVGSSSVKRFGFNENRSAQYGCIDPRK